MAVSRGATHTPAVDTSTPLIASMSHTVDANTTLLVVTFHCEGNNSISAVNWNTSEAMTLISSVTSSSAGGDCRVYAFGLVNPTSGAHTLSWTVSGAGDNLAVVPINYLGTPTSSVADATNPIDTEDNGNNASQTVALSGATTSGAALFLAGTFYGADGDPATESTAGGFSTVETGQTGTSTFSDTSYYVGDDVDGGTGGMVSPTIDWTGTASDECVGLFIEILAAASPATAPELQVSGLVIELTYAASQGQTVNLGQAISTETGQALGKTKSKSIGQAIENVTAQVIGPMKSVTLGQALETETGQILDWVRARTVNQAVETETGQAIGKTKTTPIGQASSSEIGQPIVEAKTRNLIQAVETETGQALGKTKATAVDQAISTETGQPITEAKIATVSQAVSTETGQPITVDEGGTTVPVGQAVETDIAQVLGKTKATAVGQAVSTETSQILSRSKIRSLSQATSLETATALTRSKSLLTGQASSDDMALGLARFKARLLTQAVELDTAEVVIPVVLVEEPYTMEPGTALAGRASSGAAVGVIAGGGGLAGSLEGG